MLQQTLPSITQQINSMKQSSALRIINFCNNNFGFMRLKNKKIWFNIRRVIGGMKLTEHHSHSANMKCYNLCVTTPPPNNMA